MLVDNGSTDGRSACATRCSSSGCAALGPALRRSAFLARTVPRDSTSALAVWDAVRGLPWLVRARRPRPAEVEARLAVLDETQRRSRARRYVG